MEKFGGIKYPRVPPISALKLHRQAQYSRMDKNEWYVVKCAGDIHGRQNFSKAMKYRENEGS